MDASTRMAINLTGSTDIDRADEDFYRTPEAVTMALLERESFDGTIWEPACGDGAIAKILGPSVYASDLIDRGYGDVGIDFLKASKRVDHIVTNPPYTLAQRFVEHALTCAEGKVAMLLKLNFLEGIARKPFLESSPLRCVYVFANRISFERGYEPNRNRGLLAYAWFVWQRGHAAPPVIAWLTAKRETAPLTGQLSLW